MSPPVLEVLRFSMIIENLELASLSAAFGLRPQLEATIKQALAYELAIKSEAVSVELSAGSVVVHAGIYPKLSGLKQKCPRNVCEPGSQSRQVALKVMTSVGLAQAVQIAILGIPSIEAVASGPVHVSDISIKMSSGSFGGLKPSHIQFLTRDPCLVRQLRAEEPVFRRAFSQMLGIAPQRLLIEPPAAVDNTTTARALALLQRDSCGLPPRHRQHLSNEQADVAQPGPDLPSTGLLARSRHLRRGGTSSLASVPATPMATAPGAAPSPGGWAAPSPSPASAFAKMLAPWAASVGSWPPPLPGGESSAVFGPMGSPGGVAAVTTTTPPEVNRPWLAWWRLSILPPGDEAVAMELIKTVNTPHGPFDGLLPLTLARVPSLGYPSFEGSKLGAVELPQPRNVALHLGPVPGGDRSNDLTRAALALQAKAEAELRYGQELHKAIQQAEVRLSTGFNVQAGFLTGKMLKAPMVHPVAMGGFGPESPYGPYAPDEVPWDVAPAP